MTSILLIALDKNAAKNKAEQLCTHYGIDPLDVSVIEISDTIGIEEVRSLKQKLYLKPLKGTQKATIIYDAHTLTIEAQNAFLKTLEEPPFYTYIILVANSLESFLPTILSRCSIITLEQKPAVVLTQEINTLQDTLICLTKTTISQKLYFAQELGDTQSNALVWLEKVIHFFRSSLLDQDDFQTFETNQYLFLLENFQNTHHILKTTNVNPRFALENLFLSLSF